MRLLFGFVFLDRPNLDLLVMLVHDLIYWLLWIRHSLTLKLAGVINVFRVHKILGSNVHFFGCFGNDFRFFDDFILSLESHWKCLFCCCALDVLELVNCLT